MAMFTVDYSNQLRAAFNAGRAAGMAPFIRAKVGTYGTLTEVPQTYEEWIASVRHDPVAIG